MGDISLLLHQIQELSHYKLTRIAVLSVNSLLTPKRFANGLPLGVAKLQTSPQVLL